MQAVNDAVVYLVCLGIYVLITWQAVVGGRVRQISNVVASDVVRVPVYPFQYVFAFGCAVLCLVFIVDLVDSLRRVVKE